MGTEDLAFAAGKVQIKDRVYRKFRTQDLVRMFGGWFTLCYAFSIKDSKTSENIDFYICSQDVSDLPVDERPLINDVIKREFNKTVYGFAIIAPSTAFA